MKRYSIYEENLNRLEKKLNRIENKCKQYGCSFSYKKIGEEFKEVEDKYKNKHIKRFVIIEVEGTAIINNWKFIGTLQHTENGNVVRKIVDVELPTYFYDTNPICEHCNVKRYRKDTYIIQNEKTKEFKQVGKSCLKDFTMGMSAEMVAQYISMFNSLIEGQNIEGTGGEFYFHKETILKYASETVKHFGYVSKQSESKSTHARTYEYYIVGEGVVDVSMQTKEDIEKEMESVGFDISSKENIENVKNALEWILNKEDDNNYIHNLKTICSLEYVTRRDLGILISLFNAYNKELNYLKEKRKELDIKKNSSFVGEVGEKISINIDTVSCITSWETQWGYVFLNKIIDKQGNVYIWKTNSVIKDTVSSIKGTIKGHKIFDNIKQTEITRCRIER